MEGQDNKQYIVFKGYRVAQHKWEQWNLVSPVS